jgi:hypothetical protein
LQIIDSHQQRTDGSQLAQQVQQAEGDRARRRRFTIGVGAEQRDLKPSALRRRQSIQRFRFYPVQQVSQTVK